MFRFAEEKDVALVLEFIKELAAYEKMTASICDLYEKELGIPKASVYVTYHGVNDWGWNGQNF